MPFITAREQGLSPTPVKRDNNEQARNIIAGLSSFLTNYKSNKSNNQFKDAVAEELKQGKLQSSYTYDPAKGYSAQYKPQQGLTPYQQQQLQISQQNQTINQQRLQQQQNQYAQTSAYRDEEKRRKEELEREKQKQEKEEREAKLKREEDKAKEEAMAMVYSVDDEDRNNPFIQQQARKAGLVQDDQGSYITAEMLQQALGGNKYIDPTGNRTTKTPRFDPVRTAVSPMDGLMQLFTGGKEQNLVGGVQDIMSLEDAESGKVKIGGIVRDEYGNTYKFRGKNRQGEAEFEEIGQ